MANTRSRTLVRYLTISNEISLNHFIFFPGGDVAAGLRSRTVVRQIMVSIAYVHKSVVHFGTEYSQCQSYGL